MNELHTGEVKQMNEIPQQMKMLEDNVDLLEVNVSTLLAALLPVLSPETPKGEEKEDTCYTSLGQQIQSIRIRIVEMQTVTGDILSRLAL